ncbi:uncharacterized protein PV07_10544 [Cladophialophora immunda]|uniref:BAH domain-containing protein n=1 Tax=Cladophialophora immunda TaxID=569365 RepID=A0A0D1ZAX1_9EURO|nr:uncharacterized protein PV07_10544 [Cladophialophora immunda]KIW24856.1 hypothetical protein PV07_10544 [Cladophialophora immunda]
MKDSLYLQQPNTKIMILKARQSDTQKDMDLRPPQAGRLEKRRKRFQSPTGVGSNNGIKRLRSTQSSKNDGDSSELESLQSLASGEDSDDFSEYRPSTDSEYSSDGHANAPSAIRYCGLVIRKGQFVFVKNDSPEDWIARVEKFHRKQRKLYVRWMKEDGPEIVMGDGYAWLSVNTIQDIAEVERRVTDPDTEERWVHKVPVQPASLSPTGDQQKLLQTVWAEETILRHTPSLDCCLAGTAICPLAGDDPEGDRNLVRPRTTKIKLAPFRPCASREGSLPSLWDAVGDYRDNHPGLRCAEV